MTPRAQKAVASQHRLLFGTASVTPAVLLMIALLLAPAVIVAAISVTSWPGVGPITSLVGLRNYSFLLDTGGFADSLRITAVYTAVMTIVSTAFGFVLASAIQLRLRGWRLYKVAWFIPVIIPGTVTAILWSSGVFAPGFGLLDSVSGELGLPTPPSGWLGDPDLALMAVVATAVWAFTGWPMLIISAALERIPRDYYEAAQLEGANWLATTRYITLPVISPVLAAVITLQLVFGLKVFDIVYVMTGGGPSDYTTVMGILMWNWAFVSGRFAVGAAVAVLMILVISPVALLQRRLQAQVRQ